MQKIWDLHPKEKRDKKLGRGVLDGIPVAMPALLRALRAGEKAAHLGLDWSDAEGPRRKLDEELAELDHARASGDAQAVFEELGDVLFTLVSLARKHEIDPEAALRRSVDRFSERVRHIEGLARDRGIDTGALSEPAVDALWREAKEATRAK